MTRLKTLTKWTVIVLPVLLLGYVVVEKNMLSSLRQTEASGSATISWTAPTENEDDGPLTDLAGYIIHYGPHAGQYSNTIAIDDPATTSYKVENLSPGTYYFAVTAISAGGSESALSNMVVRTVP